MTTRGISSFSNLTIGGNGSLTVTSKNGKDPNAICSKGTLAFSGGNITANGVESGIRSTGYIAILGGSVKADASGENGYGCARNTGALTSLFIERATTSVVISGKKAAINHHLVNYMAGLGWTNTEGTEGETEISTESGMDVNSYKKLQFPMKIYTVIFKVKNGAWDDGTKEDKTVTLSGYKTESLDLKGDQIPAVGANPAKGYEAGSWDTEPMPDTPIKADTVYTYTFAKKEIITPTIHIAAHVQDIGWIKPNAVLTPGESVDVGTTGRAKRLEAIAVMVPENYQVSGFAHVQNVGDMTVKIITSTKDYQIPKGYVAYQFGTVGRSLRMEAVNIGIKDANGEPIKGIQYATHLQNYVWQGYVRNDSFSGTRSMCLRLEAVRFVYSQEQ